MLPFINLGKIHIPLYGLLIVAGILSAGFIVYRLCLFQKKNFYDFLIISAVGVGLGFLGAKLLYLLVTYGIKDFFQVLRMMLFDSSAAFLVGSGFVFYGGLIGGLAGYFLGIKIAKCDWLQFLDISAFVIPFVQGFGRIGCFCAGCCYGILYDGPLAVYYTNPLSDVPCGVGIFPVQLLEAFLLLLFSFVILFFIIKKSKNQSQSRFLNLFIFIVYILFYSVLRFFIEFLRADSMRGKIWIFSTSQLISLILFFLSIIILIFLRKDFCKNE